MASTEAISAEVKPPRPRDPQAPRKPKSFAALVRTNPLNTIITVAVDAISASLGLALGLWWAHRTQEVLAPFWMVALFVPLALAMLALRSAYRRTLDRSVMDEIGPVETTVALASMTVLAVLVFNDVTGKPGALMSKIWICAALLMPVGRLIHAYIQRRLRVTANSELVSPTLIVGNGRVAHQVAERLRTSPQYGLAPVGLVSLEEPWTGGDDVKALPLVGTPEDVESAIAATGAEALIIAFSRTQDQLLTRVIRVAHQHGLRVWVVPRMFDAVGEKVRVEHIGGLPLLALPTANPRGWQFAVKHILDRMLATIGLVVISPLFLTLMLLVRLSSPGPIFFKQERVGRDGQVFDCLKFRTMREPRASDAAFQLGSGSAPGGVEGVDRRTKIGKIMRATSMDELPQFINVVKGDMSLVGPRPERPEFVELFEIQIRRYGERHRVKAGVTGWAQVNGLRGQTSIADRAEWDNYYIENWSLALDIKILLMTVLAVLKRAE
ncbi:MULTISPECIES: sugar transferase [Mycobacteriaceae]|uniref:sugar transferase n=1 Tax=Mycobacteriaceae TaxID=1762 RepID=UPI0008002098|nr:MULTISPECIES: sugar transferase [Mycobacteriaceae]MCK0172831.1 sugar transferase [Mycolicibacterium sp. F2034L]OBB57753.1 UDP-phosphate galactose phosphotransferase [Mycobacterium sp. 852013-51886_SCH5428379]